MCTLSFPFLLAGDESTRRASNRRHASRFGRALAGCQSFLVWMAHADALRIAPPRPLPSRLLASPPYFSLLVLVTRALCRSSCRTSVAPQHTTNMCVAISDALTSLTSALTLCSRLRAYPHPGCARTQRDGGYDGALSPFER